MSAELIAALLVQYGPIITKQILEWVNKGTVTTDEAIAVCDKIIETPYKAYTGHSAVGLKASVSPEVWETIKHMNYEDALKVLD